MKNITVILLVLVVGLGGLWVHQELSTFDKSLSSFDASLNLYHESEEKVRLIEQQLHEQQEQERSYTILAGGDIMLDRGVESRIKSLGKNYDFPFDNIRTIISQADFAFANLEGSMSSVGVDTGKKFSFRFEPVAAIALKNSGLDIVSLANNHMLDWGQESLCETTKHLDEVAVQYVGAGCNNEDAEAPVIVNLGNTKIAFLAYTEFYKGAHATSERAGMSEFNMTKITERIRNLKKEQEIDVVMVSMHWGEEYKSRSNTFQVTTGHALIDAGADVILGHHPHVDQEIERYHNGWIIYSLGNFIFDQSFSKETMEAILAEITVQNKKVIDVRALPIEINSNFQPSLKITE